MGLSAYPVLIPFITLSPFPRDTTGPPIPPFYTEHSRIFQVKGPRMRKGSEIGAGLQRCRVWRQDNKAPVIHCQVCFSQFLQHYELHPPPEVRVHGNESTLRSDSVQKAQMKPVGWVVCFFFPELTHPAPLWHVSHPLWGTLLPETHRQTWGHQAWSSWHRQTERPPRYGDTSVPSVLGLPRSPERS